MWALVTWLAIPTAVCTRVSREGGSALQAIMPLSMVMVVLGASWLAAKNAERKRPQLDVEAAAAAMRAHGPLRKSRIPRPVNAPSQ